MVRNIPMTGAEIAAILTADFARFRSLVDALTRKQALWLVERFDVRKCRCKPACRPRPERKDYRPCPWSLKAPDHDLDNLRWEYLFARAYGYDVMTGPVGAAGNPPPAPKVLTRQKRVAVLAERAANGYRLWRDEHDDPWAKTLPPDGIVMRADGHNGNQRIEREK